jgi:hypothetical protein
MRDARHGCGRVQQNRHYGVFRAGPRQRPTSGARLVAQTPELASPIRDAGELAAAFLAGYGPATREAYARDLHAWGDYLAGLGVEVLAAHRVHVDAWARQAEEDRTARHTTI